MINGDIDIFIDTIHYGEDISLIYEGKRLFIDGWWDNNNYTIRMFDMIILMKNQFITLK